MFSSALLRLNVEIYIFSVSFTAWLSCPVNLNEKPEIAVVRVFTDLPREIQERRKKQWPKLKKAREEGKLASFDKKEPDKLYIDGHFIPM